MQVLVAVTFDNTMVIATGMFASFLACKYTQIISPAIKYHKINAEKIVLQIFLAIGNATFVLELCSRVSSEHMWQDMSDMPLRASANLR